MSTNQYDIGSFESDFVNVNKNLLATYMRVKEFWCEQENGPTDANVLIAYSHINKVGETSVAIVDTSHFLADGQEVVNEIARILMQVREKIGYPPLWVSVMSDGVGVEVSKNENEEDFLTDLRRRYPGMSLQEIRNNNPFEPNIYEVLTNVSFAINGTYCSSMTRYKYPDGPTPIFSDIESTSPAQIMDSKPEEVIRQHLFLQVFGFLALQVEEQSEIHETFFSGENNF